jgi:hypothetical protein
VFFREVLASLPFLAKTSLPGKSTGNKKSHDNLAPAGAQAFVALSRKIVCPILPGFIPGAWTNLWQEEENVKLSSG